MRGLRASGRRRWLATAVLAALGSVAAGCSAGVSSLSLPTPTTVTGPGPGPTFTTLPPNLAATAEDPVSGVTTTTAPVIGPGPATLTGTVLGPSGPVGGAVVQAERLVGDAVASTRTTSAPDGSWSLRNVLGGRYRLRAWKAPDLDLTTPQIVFLTDSQPLSLDLQLAVYPSPQVSAALNPAIPVQDQPVNLVVQVVDPTVGANGVLSYAPVTGRPVTLVDGSGWMVSGANPGVTDGQGRVLFGVMCTVAGADPLSAQPAGAPAAPLQMPPCAAPPAQVPPPGSTAQPGGSTTTSTTCPFPSGAPNQPDATTTTLLFGNC